MKDNRVKEEFYNWGIDGIDLLYNQRSQKAPPPFLRLHRPDLSMVEENFNADISKAAKLVLSAEYLTVLTGVGVSVESGVRPFRGPGGLWTEKGEPAMDSYQRFLSDPKCYWERRSRPREETGPWRAISGAKPNPGHITLAELECLGIVSV